MDVFQPGTEVKILKPDDSELSGRVLRVLIDSNGIRYIVAYWNNDSRKTDTFMESEVSVGSGFEGEIGFVSEHSKRKEALSILEQTLSNSDSFEDQKEDMKFVAEQIGYYQFCDTIDQRLEDEN